MWLFLFLANLLFGIIQVAWFVVEPQHVPMLLTGLLNFFVAGLLLSSKN